MKVTTGSARGTTLIAPEGLHTRPITDQIKQAIFSSWQFRIPDCNFLDIFAGSGSMGIEALSRGATKATFVDNDKTAINIINTNLKNCHFKIEQYEVLKDDAFVFLQRIANKVKYDVIYMDPPYTVDEIFIPIIEEIDKANVLQKDGILAIRTKAEKQMPSELTNLVKTKEKKYGISMVHYYKNKSS